MSESHILEKLHGTPTPAGPVVLCILDGFGIPRAGQNPNGNCRDAVKPKFIDEVVEAAKRTGHYCELGAHGPAVGLPTDGDMGNSEVGHNAIGCGQIYDQGAKLVLKSLTSGDLFRAQGWTGSVLPAIEAGKAVHLFGLLSDGNVHSHIQHCEMLMDGAVASGAKKVYLHALLDGRDVAPDSALIYLGRIEEHMAKLRAAHPDVDVRIASGGGRMVSVMDRYESDWSMVERGFHQIVHGEVDPKFIGAKEDGVEGAGYAGYYLSAADAVKDARRCFPSQNDQFVPPFVLVERRCEHTCKCAKGVNGVGADVAELAKGMVDGGEFVPVARVREGDVVINFNFRGDRALQISRAMDAPLTADFPKIRRDTAARKTPKFSYVGMLEYDSDAKIPAHYLLPPPPIKDVMLDYLLNTPGRDGRPFKVLQVAETHKYGHVTYFFNGNRAAPLREGTSQECREKIESYPPEIPLETVPGMKATEVGERVCQAIRSGDFDLIVVNFANPDMIGHTGDMDAVCTAIRVCDSAVFKIYKELEAAKGVLLLTADHGNAEEMLEGGFHKTDNTWGGLGDAGVALKTSHTLNAVDLSIVDFAHPDAYTVVGGPRDLAHPDVPGVAGRVGIANIAATIMNILGYAAPSFYERSLIKFN